MFIDDLGLVFEFIASFSGSFLSFIMPGMFFIIAEKKYGSSVDAESRKWTRIGAYGFVVF
jgi:hypothetical protein